MRSLSRAKSKYQTISVHYIRCDLRRYHAGDDLRKKVPHSNWSHKRLRLPANYTYNWVAFLDICINWAIPMNSQHPTTLILSWSSRKMNVFHIVPFFCVVLLWNPLTTYVSLHAVNKPPPQPPFVSHTIALKESRLCVDLCWKGTLRRHVFMLIIILPLALIIDVDDNGQPRRGRRSLVIVVGRFRKKKQREVSLSLSFCAVC